MSKSSQQGLVLKARVGCVEEDLGSQNENDVKVSQNLQNRVEKVSFDRERLRLPRTFAESSDFELSESKKQKKIHEVQKFFYEASSHVLAKLFVGEQNAEIGSDKA